MLKEYRARFKNNLVFLQAECDLVQRRGDFTRAIELTREIDAISKTSAMGPLLRARLYASVGNMRELADAYKDALDREPRQLDLRILLGQAQLLLHEPDEALRQAGLVLAAEKNRPDAVLLEARALAQAGDKSASGRPTRNQRSSGSRPPSRRIPSSAKRFGRWPRSTLGATIERLPRRSSSASSRPVRRTPRRRPGWSSCSRDRSRTTPIPARPISTRPSAWRRKSPRAIRRGP